MFQQDEEMEDEPSAPDTIMMPNASSNAALSGHSVSENPGQQAPQQAPQQANAAPASQATISANAFAAALAQAMGMVTNPQPGS